MIDCASCAPGAVTRASHAYAPTHRPQALKSLLVSRGVTLNEAQAIWHTADGRGGALAFPEASGYLEALTQAAAELSGDGGASEVAVSVDDIPAALTQREQARAQRNFVVADRIREALRAKGVELDDVNREWMNAADGSGGRFPEMMRAEAVSGVTAGATLTDEEIVAIVAQVREPFPQSVRTSRGPRGQPRVTWLAEGRVASRGPRRQPRAT